MPTYARLTSTIFSVCVRVYVCMFPDVSDTSEAGVPGGCEPPNIGARK